jgi:hypothetical protein
MRAAITKSRREAVEKLRVHLAPAIGPSFSSGKKIFEINRRHTLFLATAKLTLMVWDYRTDLFRAFVV